MVNLYVSKSGNNGNDGLSQSNSLLTIQAALDKCGTVFNEDYIIHISEGVYEENAFLNNKKSCSISIIGTNVTVNGSIENGYNKLYKGITFNLTKVPYIYHTNTSLFNDTVVIEDCVYNTSQDKILNHYTGSGVYRKKIICKNTEFNSTGSVSNGLLFSNLETVELDNISYNIPTGSKLISTSVDMNVIFKNMTVNDDIFKVNIVPKSIVMDNCTFDETKLSYFIKDNFKFTNCTISNPKDFTSQWKNSNPLVNLNKLYFIQNDPCIHNDKYMVFNNGIEITKSEDLLDIEFKKVNFDGYNYAPAVTLSRFYVTELKPITLSMPIKFNTTSSAKLSLGIFKSTDILGYTNPIVSKGIGNQELLPVTLEFTPELEGEYFIVFNYENRFIGNYIYKMQLGKLTMQ